MSKKQKSNPMTPEAARRIQSATAKQNGGKVPKGSFAARAQSIVDQKINKKPCTVADIPPL